MENALTRWRLEKTAAYLSGAVAAAKPDPPAVPAFTPSLRSRLTVWLIGVFGPRAMRPVLSARMFLIGSAAAAATYMIGSLFNVSGI
jgi:hypothetical protein